MLYYEQDGGDKRCFKYFSPKSLECTIDEARTIAEEFKIRTYKWNERNLPKYQQHNPATTTTKNIHKVIDLSQTTGEGEDRVFANNQNSSPPNNKNEMGDGQIHSSKFDSEGTEDSTVVAAKEPVSAFQAISSTGNNLTTLNLLPPAVATQISPQTFRIYGAQCSSFHLKVTPLNSPKSIAAVWGMAVKEGEGDRSTTIQAGIIDLVK